MAENANSTVYIGNLDERVNDRVLYDILIEAGRVVDLHIPRDRETDKPKGYAFAQYETDEVADYAVRLFSGLVTLYSRTLKFAISGRDKERVSLLVSTPPPFNSHLKPRPHHVPSDGPGVSSNSLRLSSSSRFSDHQINHSQGDLSPGLSVHQTGGYRSPYDNSNNDYNRRVFGAAVDSVTRSRLGRFEMHSSTNYHPSY